jgi:hypothetical protein
LEKRLYRKTVDSRDGHSLFLDEASFLKKLRGYGISDLTR